MNPNEDFLTPEERHAFEHPEDHANVSKPAEAEECCGGHCGDHEIVVSQETMDDLHRIADGTDEEAKAIVDGFKGAMEMVKQQTEPPFRRLTPEEIAERDRLAAEEAAKPRVMKLPVPGHDWCMPDCGQHKEVIVTDDMTAERLVEIVAGKVAEMPPQQDGPIEPWSPRPFYDKKGRRQNDIHHNTPFKPLKNELKGLGRNTPCPCGSGKKYKKCCLNVIEDNN